MDAVQRASELYQMRWADIPEPARAYVRYLQRETGAGSEVFLSAFAIFAQCVEGLRCSEAAYKARPEDREWFRQQGFTKAKDAQLRA